LRAAFRQRAKRLLRWATVSLCLVALAGCGMLPEASEAELLELIEPPAISEKPVYTVARVTIEEKATGTGRLLSDPQAELAFREEGRRVRSVSVGSGDKVAKGQVLAELETDDLELQILRKEIDIRKKELAIQGLLREDEAAVEGERDVAARELELLRAELRQLRERLDGSRLVAPFDGTVTSLAVEAGDVAKAYETMAVVSDLSGLVAAASFGDSDLAALAVGMEAVVELNAAGALKGRIVRLPTAGASGSADGPTLDGSVLVEADALPEGATVGTPLSVTVVTLRRENAVAIPPAALRTHAGRTYVQTVDEAGNKREVDVEVGLQTATEVEILKGLEPGMKVVGR
jgi:macrolide-specific efflux system membrane fusion protein